MGERYLQCQCGQLLTYPERRPVPMPVGSCEVLTLGVGLTCRGKPCSSVREPGYDANGSPVEAA